MHSSYFEYNIQKPYPLRWFTPAVIIGGTIVTALFTFLTVATSGYNLQPLTTTNPNATMNQDYWFTRAPFAWRGSLRPTCQVHELPIGSQLFTSNLGFSYQLTAVSKVNSSTGRIATALPSLPYLNQELKDCKVIDIELFYHRVDLAPNAAYWWSWGDGYAQSRANCTVPTPDGDLLATFTTTYSVPKRDFSYVIQNDLEADASMWWATRLLNAYYTSTLVALAWMKPPANTDASTVWMRGFSIFTTNQTQDIKSNNLFSLDFFFIASDSNIDNRVQQPLSLMFNNANNNRSEVLTQSLTFARTMYSAILVDLGQSRTSNLLLDPSLLQWQLAHPNDVFRNDPENVLNCTDSHCYSEYYRFNQIAGPENFDNSFASTDQQLSSPRYEQVMMPEAFEKFKPAQSGPGSLGTKNATIYTQYACSVPVRKDGGAIFLAVILAVLVYLRAAWALLRAIAKPFVKKADPLGANTCYGDSVVATRIRTGNSDGEDGHGLLALRTQPSHKGYTGLADSRSVDEGLNSNPDLGQVNHATAYSTGTPMTSDVKSSAVIQQRPHLYANSSDYHAISQDSVPILNQK